MIVILIFLSFNFYARVKSDLHAAITVLEYSEFNCTVIFTTAGLHTGGFASRICQAPLASRNGHRWSEGLPPGP